MIALLPLTGTCPVNFTGRARPIDLGDAACRMSSTSNRMHRGVS